jgi:hypothetical protein
MGEVLPVTSTSGKGFTDPGEASMSEQDELEFEKELEAEIQAEWDSRGNMTPEQRHKLEMKITALSLSAWVKENPEGAKRAVKYFLDIPKVRQEAERYYDAMHTHGTSSFQEYARENPLSPRASIHLSIIQKEADEKAHKPVVEKLTTIQDGYKNREDHQDRQDFIGIVKKIHKPGQTIGSIIEAPELAWFRQKYRGKHTLRGWAKEALPNHKFRTGRPPVKKTNT